MKITSSGILGAVGNVGQVKTALTRKQEPETQATGKFYDQITLSSGKSGDDTALRQVSAGISHEVRTHNTTGKIAELRDAVQSGTYQMDARDTAARMLLMGAVE